MTARKSVSRDPSTLIDNMFQDVFSVEERAALRDRILAWEATQPQLSPADRITAWIDIAYTFQHERGPSGESWPVSRFAPSIS